MNLFANFLGLTYLLCLKRYSKGADVELYRPCFALVFFTKFFCRKLITAVFIFPILRGCSKNPWLYFPSIYKFQGLADVVTADYSDSNLIESIGVSDYTPKYGY